MDKSVIEKYFTVYPEVDQEISRLKSEISHLEEEKQEYTLKIDEFSISLLETINDALESAKEELSESYKAKAFVKKALTIMDTRQKKIIELRFWNGQLSPTGWDYIANEMRYHKKSIEKIYRRFVEKILVS